MVDVRNPLGDRQAQTRALGAAGRIQLDETVEDARAIGFGNTPAAVADAYVDV